MKNQKQEFAELDRALDEFLEKRKAPARKSRPSLRRRGKRLRKGT